MDPMMMGMGLLGGLFGGGKGSSSQSASNASNTLSVAFNPNVFAANGGGSYTPSTNGAPNASATGTPSADYTSSPSSSIPWAYPSNVSRPDISAYPSVGGTATAGSSNSMMLMLMLGVGALYIVSTTKRH